MTGRRAIFGLCVFWAMAFSAIAAQAASAAGQTAFTCVSTAKPLEFKTEHCVPGETGTAFGHEAFSVETHATFSNEKTNAETNGRSNWVLKETIAAITVELESTGLIDGLGTLKNEEVGGVMQASAESDANGITFNGVVVKAPAGKGCEIFEDVTVNHIPSEGAKGVVKTQPVKGHTIVVKDKEGGVEKERHSVLIEPVTAPVFATFWITCSPAIGPIEGTWEITGTFTCPTNGATIVCNHETITTANTLKGKGAKAGLTGKATITAGKFPVGEPTHPISVTTTP